MTMNDLLVMDQNFESVALIDTFEELIWADRYSAYGDFEISTAVDSNILRVAQQDYYLWSNDSEHTMIVEQRVINSDIESGNHIVISGRSLESIITRRIVWFQTNLTGNLQNAIRKLLNENIISPADSNRRISNFIFEASTDPAVTGLTVDAQFTGDNLYDAIKTLCDEKGIGFKVTLNDTNQFVFKLYAGADRSYSQEVNPHIVFSQSFDNIKNSNYLETMAVLKTVALVAGEGEGTARRTTTVGGGTGLGRREMFVDARDISSDTEDGKLTDAQYNSLMAQRGNERLAENIFVKAFEGDVETTLMFVYKEDFFLGDVVQIVNEYGIEARTRVGEIIISQNREGYNVVPTFVVV
jgi:hypothetical protein